MIVREGFFNIPWCHNWKRF